jgi:hypothetical protein
MRCSRITFCSWWVENFWVLSHENNDIIVNYWLVNIKLPRLKHKKSKPICLLKDRNARLTIAHRSSITSAWNCDEQTIQKFQSRVFCLHVNCSVQRRCTHTNNHVRSTYCQHQAYKCTGVRPFSSSDILLGQKKHSKELIRWKVCKKLTLQPALNHHSRRCL